MELVRERGGKTFVEELEGRRLLAASAWVYASPHGEDLLYQPTALGDRVVDFSGVGYADNRTPIPDVPPKVLVRPERGDDQDRIQRAINQVSRMPMDPKSGFRGAVILERGTYQIGTRLKIAASGVVLRGAGDGKTGTTLVATGDEVRPLINVNPNGRSNRPALGSARKVTDKYVPVGARSFHLDDVAGLAAGDRIVVRRPSTPAWLALIGMDRLEIPWQPGTKNLDWERTITRIEGNKVTVDDPLTHSLDQRFGGGQVMKGNLVRRLHNIGIEDIRGDADVDSSTDRFHAEFFAHFEAVEQAWMRRVTVRHFTQGAATVEFGARSITIENVSTRDPDSPIDGNLRYSFNLERGAEKVLVRDVLSVDGRHDFVTDGSVHGPNVFVDAVARHSHADTGPHMHYATGLLFDNVRTNHEINVRNRGDKGTNHGWAGANNVVWNSTAGGVFRVRNPSGAQNWLIGGIGRIDHVSEVESIVPLPNDPGIYDGFGAKVTPRSLYYAQLAARDEHPAAEDREYSAGDIDGYASGGAADDVFVDPVWRSAVKTLAGDTVASFDRSKRQKKWVPFSFQFDLDPGERVVSASLSIGLKRTGRNAERERVYIDSLRNGRTFKTLGWDDLKGGAEARVIDLNGQLKRLQDGLFNIAIQDNIAVDWAILQLRVEPASPSKQALARPARGKGRPFSEVVIGPAPVRAKKSVLDEQPGSIYD